MECLQSRIDSFSKAKRVKNPNKPSTSVTLKWPHPASFVARPDTLAEAGFYFDPSPDDPDNCSCFMCDKQLGGWEDEDDPFDIHFDKCAHECGWASVRCGLRRDMDANERYVFPDKSRMPTSKVMEKARLQTFTAGDGWIHDTVRGHGANSKKLAKAGFVYTPIAPGDDSATCLYCGCSLGGWDKDDDPMVEHKKRKDKSDYPCPFFSSNSDYEPAQSSSKPMSRASSSKPSSSRPSKAKQHQDLLMPTKTFDGDPDGTDNDEDASDYSSKSSKSSATTAKTPARKARTTGASTTRKPKATTAKTPRARKGKNALKDVIEADEEDADEVVELLEAPTVKKKRAPSKARTKNVIISAASELTEGPLVDEPVEPPPPTKKKRARSKSVARSVASPAEVEVLDFTDDASEVSVPPPPTIKKKKKNAREKSVARSVASEMEVEIVDDLSPPAPATVKKKKATTARSKPKSIAQSHVVAQSDDDESPAPAVEETVKKPSRSKGKAKAVPVPVASEEEEEAMEEAEPIAQKPSKSKSKSGPSTTRKPSSRAKAKPKPVEPDTEPEVEDEGQFETAAEEPEVLRPRTSKKPSSKSAAAKAKAQKAAELAAQQQQTEGEGEDEEVSEDEFGPVIEQPHFAPAAIAASKNKAKEQTKGGSKKSPDAPMQNPLAGAASLGKGKPPSLRAKPSSPPTPPTVPEPSSMDEDEDDDLGGYIPAQSSPAPPPVPPSETTNGDGEEDMEMTPLVIPKRAAAPSSSSLRAKAAAQAAAARDREREREEEEAAAAGWPSSPLPDGEGTAKVDYEEQDMDMTPLAAPKRSSIAAQTTSSSLRAQATVQAVKEKDRAGSSVSGSTGKTNGAKAVRPSQAGKPPSSKVRAASISKNHDRAKMKVVDVLSSDDDEADDDIPGTGSSQPAQPPVSAEKAEKKLKPKVEETRKEESVAPERRVEKAKAVEVEVEAPAEVRVDLQSKTKTKSRKASAQAKKSLMFSASIPALDQDQEDERTARATPKPEPPKDERMPSTSSLQHAPVPIPQPVSSRSQSQQSLRDQAEVADQLGANVAESEEVSMQDTAQDTNVPDAQPIQGDVEMEDPAAPPANPRTPPRVAEPKVPPPSNIQDAMDTDPKAPMNPVAAPPFFPPLSKLPFVPIPELTEAELDMTVEEWIRYQMEVEFDKFRRDGERELQRFRKRAEETRKVIEGL